MLEAYWPHIVTFFLTIAVAVLISGVRTFALSRECRRLRLRVNDIEDRLLSVRGKEAAKARWDADKWSKDAMTELQPTPTKSKRYDNDPME
jgi:hypothetical protein